MGLHQVDIVVIGQADQLGEELAAAGRVPYVIHLSMAHPPIGGLGYVNAGTEISQQVRGGRDEPDLVIVPSGSGLTHAGLLLADGVIGDLL